MDQFYLLKNKKIINFRKKGTHLCKKYKFIIKKQEMY
jgi:hypothetical protein